MKITEEAFELFTHGCGKLLVINLTIFDKVNMWKTCVWKSINKWKTLKLFSAFHCSDEGEFIGIFKVCTNGHTISKSAHADTKGFDKP